MTSSAGKNTTNETIIELSIMETQILRAKLGLAPLVISSSGANGDDGGTAALPRSDVGDSRHDEEEELSLSIDATNLLRDKIGLPPLNVDANNRGNANTTNSGSCVHAPAHNTARTKEIRQRLEDASAKRDARYRLERLEFEVATEEAGEEDDGGDDALDFATKMRRGGKRTDHINQQSSSSSSSAAAAAAAAVIAGRRRENKNNGGNNDVDAVKDDDDNNNKLIVGHDPSSFIAGSTTILTLVDKPLLDGEEGGDDDNDCNDNNNNLVLTNVDMDDDAKLTNNLRTKRMIELGAGRAGGYSGYDDYEFDELGGISGSSIGGGFGSSSIPGMFNSTGAAVAAEGKRNGNGGFVIDARGGIVDTTQAETGAAATTIVQDALFGNGGRPISLQSRGPSRIASDYYTHDELLLLDSNNNNNTDAATVLLEKENKRNLKIVHKLRTKEEKRMAKANKRQKMKRHTRRMVDDNSDDDDDDDVRRTKSKKEESLEEGDDDAGVVASKNSLLSSLEATAVGVDVSLGKKGRQRDDDDKDETMQNNDGGGEDNVQIYENNDKEEDEEARIVAERRHRYDDIMAKGKARSDKAFKTELKNAMLPSSLNNDDDDDDGDDDDAFLNAALAKARRLQRLRELNGSVGGMPNTIVKVEGEEAVIHAVQQMKRKEEEDAAATAAATLTDGGDLVTTNKSDRITFEVDEIQEFTRALRARDDEDQSSLRHSNSIDDGIIIGEEAGEEEDGGNAPSHVLTVPDANANNIVATSSTFKAESDVVESTDNVDDDADMEEMARDMEVDNESVIDDDDHDGLGYDGDDTTSGLTREAPIGGRGMSSFLSHLRHTGEIRNHSTKEEMRGRAKDKRTYEDYEKLDLSTVVKIGTNGTAPHEKDAELARREIKLEYRDEHGRLLTRKEAYRDMCYQFHGYGSSKKNQERRLKQIEKERTEGSKGGTAGSASTVGTLGALKATQKATGKAFIIHKT